MPVQVEEKPFFFFFFFLLAGPHSVTGGSAPLFFSFFLFVFFFLYFSGGQQWLVWIHPLPLWTFNGRRCLPDPLGSVRAFLSTAITFCDRRKTPSAGNEIDSFYRTEKKEHRKKTSLTSRISEPVTSTGSPLLELLAVSIRTLPNGFGFSTSFQLQFFF